MGNAKQKWTAEEEAALHAGIRKHGPGKWQTIVKDPEFQPQLSNRTNIDLKDKWRNIKMAVNATAPGSKEKFGKVKGEIITEDRPPSDTRNPVFVPSHAKGESANTITIDLPHLSPDGKTAQDVKIASGNHYSDMIFEAFSAIPNTNGCEISEIYRFIQQKHEVQENFKRLLSSRLRRLVSQGKLERDQNRYKLKKDAWLEADSPKPKKRDVKQCPKPNLGYVTPAPRQNDVRPCPTPDPGLVTPAPRQNDVGPCPTPDPGLVTPTPRQNDVRPCPTLDPAFDTYDETMEAAAISAAEFAADMICDAESASFDAAKKVTEAETLEREAEDAETLLMLSMEIYEQCLRSGVVIISI